MSDNKLTPTFGDAAPTQSTQTPTNPAASKAPQNALAMLSGLGTRTASGSGSTKTPGEVLVLFKDMATAVQKETTALPVHALLVEDPVLNIPAIVLYAVRDDCVMFVPLLLEALGERLSNAVEHIQGSRSIEVDRPTTRYYDKTMRNICENAVRFAISKSNDKVNICLSVAHVVIKNGIDLENADKLAPFYDAAVSSITGNLRARAGHPMSDMTSKILIDSSIQVIARNEIHPGSTYATANGDVVNGDFCINLIARPTQQDTTDIHNTGNEVTLSSVTGFIDFAYRAPDTMSPHQVPGAQIQPVPAYDPMVIITDISPLGKSIRADDDLLSQLLGLTSLAGTIANMRWATIFTRAGNDKGSKTSIGAFGLEHNPYGAAVKHTPKVLNVTAGELAAAGDDAVTPLNVIQTYCTPTMTVALDITQGGPLSWVQEIFATATPRSDSEYLVIKELDAFSGNRFSQIWDGSKSILAMPSIEVHLGYYTDKDGDIKDIRSLDYLTMLEASKADLTVMEPYSRALSPMSCDKLALDEMRKIIKTFAPNVTFTGLATRVFFNTDFINALDSLLVSCGLNVTLEGLNDLNAGAVRGSMFNTQNAQVNTQGAFNIYGGTGAVIAPLNPLYNGSIPGYTRA